MRLLAECKQTYLEIVWLGIELTGMLPGGAISPLGQICIFLTIGVTISHIKGICKYIIQVIVKNDVGITDKQAVLKHCICYFQQKYVSRNSMFCYRFTTSPNPMSGRRHNIRGWSTCG